MFRRDVFGMKGARATSHLALGFRRPFAQTPRMFNSLGRSSLSPFVCGWHVRRTEGHSAINDTTPHLGCRPLLKPCEEGWVPVVSMRPMFHCLLAHCKLERVSAKSHRCVGGALLRLWKEWYVRHRVLRSEGCVR